MSAVRAVGIGFALLAIAASARAGELQFSAAVDQTTVGLGQQFQLVLTVQGEDMLSVPSPVLPALDGITVLGRSTSQSTSISIENGQMKKQATVEFVYGLTANKLGRAVIPPCKLTYQGKDYTTQPIELTVVRAPQGQATPAPGPPGAGATGSGPAGQVPLDGNLFLSATPSRRTVYVGEPVTLDITLGTRFQVTNGGWAVAPSFDGFWAENLFEADRFDFQRRTIDGRPFGVTELREVTLFPLSAGDATIKPMSFNVTVAQPARDFFDLFGSAQTVRVESKPVTLHVLPLPERDKPKEFTGGVGAFTLDASLDRHATTNGEPVNLVVRVAGTGNLHMIDPPEIPAVAGLKILAPEVKDDEKAQGEGGRGSRTFRYPILPQGDGRFELPPVVFAYFDPHARAYRTLRSGVLGFTAGGSVVSAPVAETSGLRVLGTDIAYIKPDAAALSPVPLDPPWWPDLLDALALALVGTALGYRVHSERLASDRGYARKSRSAGLVRRRLRDAEQHLKRGDLRGFHAELARALMGWIGDRLNLDTQAFTREQLRSELAQRRVEPTTIDDVLAIVDRCEVARFSPAAAEGREPRELLDRARVVMGRIA